MHHLHAVPLTARRGHRSCLPLAQASLSWFLSWGFPLQVALFGSTLLPRPKRCKQHRFNEGPPLLQGLSCPLCSTEGHHPSLRLFCCAIPREDHVTFTWKAGVRRGEELPNCLSPPHPKHLNLDTECLGSSECSWSWKPPASHFLNWP